MAITTALCTSYKQGLFEARHNHLVSGGDTFRIGLFATTTTGTHGAATTVYADVTGNSDEATGTGYTAGGDTLTRVDPATSGTTAYIDFSDNTWSASTISASGCFVYNDSSPGDSMVFVYDFGGTVSSSAGNFTIVFPAATASTAIVRLA
jgi:hypothetical protein